MSIFILKFTYCYGTYFIDGICVNVGIWIFSFYFSFTCFEKFAFYLYKLLFYWDIPLFYPNIFLRTILLGDVNVYWGFTKLFISVNNAPVYLGSDTHFIWLYWGWMNLELLKLDYFELL